MPRENRRPRSEDRKDDRDGGRTEGATENSRDRIRQEPAQVGEGELRREELRPLVGVGGALDQPAGRGLDQGESAAEEKPADDQGGK